MKYFLSFLYATFLSSLILQNADARELEIINWGDTDIYLCVGKNESVTETGAGGSWMANTLVISGWTKVAAHSKFIVKSSSSHIELLINTGMNQYATFSNFNKSTHFFHPTTPFTNRVTGGSGKPTKDKGSIQVKGKPWILYGSKNQPNDLPLKYGFVWKTFYKVPHKIKVLNINR